MWGYPYLFSFRFFDWMRLVLPNKNFITRKNPVKKIGKISEIFFDIFRNKIKKAVEAVSNLGYSNQNDWKWKTKETINIFGFAQCKLWVFFWVQSSYRCAALKQKWHLCNKTINYRHINFISYCVILFFYAEIVPKVISELFYKIFKQTLRTSIAYDEVLINYKFNFVFLCMKFENSDANSWKIFRFSYYFWPQLILLTISITLFNRFATKHLLMNNTKKCYAYFHH